MRSEALCSKFEQYIRTILRLIREGAEVRKQEFFMKMSYTASYAAYFKNYAF